ncbi:unnamed protein product [Trichobilharzia szidati]|nr:unnamed protein product [Trichobilharzia szidati]
MDTGITDSQKKDIQATSHTSISIRCKHTTTFQHVIGGSWMFKMISHHPNNTIITIIYNYNYNTCSKVSKSGVSIILMCKNRRSQLYVTLSTGIPLLQREQLRFRIFNIELIEHGLFNRDLAPLDGRIPYGCDEQVKQMAVHFRVGKNTEDFTLIYPEYIGGILKISNEHCV